MAGIRKAGSNGIIPGAGEPAGRSDVSEAGQSDGDAELISPEDITTQSRADLLKNLLGIDQIMDGTNGTDQGGTEGGD